MTTPTPSSSELQRMRIKSGEIKDNRPLVTFLYKLMRDVITPGHVEEILLQAGIDGPVTTPHDAVFTNGWLAQYAQDIAWRLTGWDHPWPVSDDNETGGIPFLSEAEVAELKAAWLEHKNDPPVILNDDDCHGSS